MKYFDYKSRNVFKIARYLWEYFHNYFITAICIFAVFLYYIYCIFSRYYIDIDVCLGHLVKGNYETLSSYNIKNSSGKSIIKFAAINDQIEKKNYSHAIKLIDGVKTMLGDRNILYKYLTIRQALLYIPIAQSEEDYVQFVKTNYLLTGDDALRSLVSIYRLCKAD